MTNKGDDDGGPSKKQEEGGGGGGGGMSRVACLNFKRSRVGVSCCCRKLKKILKKDVVCRAPL